MKALGPPRFWVVVHLPFVSSLFHCMCVLNVKRMSTKENNIHVMSYLFSWSKINAAYI